MSDWEVTRQQGVIGGRLLDQDNSPVAYAAVTLTSFPETFGRTISAASADRLHTTTRPDGYFCFFNLPDGDYKVTVECRSQKIEKKSTVNRDSGGNLRLNFLEFTLSSGASECKDTNQRA